VNNFLLEFKILNIFYIIV